MANEHDVDFFVLQGSSAYQQNPQRVLRALRSGPSVHRSAVTGMYYVTGHAAATQLLRSPNFGRDLSKWDSPFNVLRPDNAQGDRWTPRILAALQPFMLNLDGLEHRRMRRAFQGLFLPQVVAGWLQSIAQLVERVGSVLPAAGPCDLVPGIAEPLPMRLVGQLFGVPVADAEPLRVWTTELLRSMSPVAQEHEKQAAWRALQALQDYTARLLAAARRCPPTPFMAQLLTAAQGGAGDDGVSEQELLINLIGLLFAAHETVMATIANGLFVLLSHPEALSQVRAQPELLPTAVEECLRLEPPSTVTPRVALTATELGGVALPQGSLCFCVHAAVSRDPACFEEPDRFEPARHPNPHLAFGSGIHHCLGVTLARMQAQAVLRYLLGRYRHLALAKPEPVWEATASVRRLSSLQVELGS